MKNLNLLKIVKNFAPICASVMCVLRRITRHQIVLDLPLCFIQQIKFDKDTDVALQELFGKCIIPEFKCNPESRFRSYSGNCNNLFNPSLGSHLTEFGRILPAEYDDHVSSPRQNSFLPHK